MLTDLVNSDSITAKKLVVKFFEPGHTFMSADSVHAAIEAVIRRKRASIVDLEDLTTAIEDSGCNVTLMYYSEFYSFISGLTEHKLKKNRKQ